VRRRGQWSASPPRRWLDAGPLLPRLAARGGRSANARRWSADTRRGRGDPPEVVHIRPAREHCKRLGIQRLMWRPHHLRSEAAADETPQGGASALRRWYRSDNARSARHVPAFIRVGHALQTTLLEPFDLTSAALAAACCSAIRTVSETPVVPSLRCAAASRSSSLQHTVFRRNQEIMSDELRILHSPSAFRAEEELSILAASARALEASADDNMKYRGGRCGPTSVLFGCVQRIRGDSGRGHA
jgi:hypothetical protein